MQDFNLRRLREEIDQARKKAESEADRMHRKLRSQWDDWLSRPTTREQLPVGAFIASGVVSTALVVLAFATVRYFHRVPNADWITLDMLRGRRLMKGYVTKVRDNDNFRFFHTRNRSWAQRGTAQLGSPTASYAKGRVTLCADERIMVEDSIRAA